MNQSPKLTIVIPVKQGSDADTTLWSLQESSFQDFKIVIVPDQGRGANWARNEGFGSVDTEFVLFSDNDIKWDEKGIYWLMLALEENPEASYSYGVWNDNRGELSFEEFDAVELKRRNYISTMSVIRTKDFCGFDENIDRLQDWDLWLSMLEEGKVGVNCGRTIFSTVTSNRGITNDSVEDYQKAKQVIINKHELPNISPSR